MNYPPETPIWEIEEICLSSQMRLHGIGVTTWDLFNYLYFEARHLIDDMLYIGEADRIHERLRVVEMPPPTIEHPTAPAAKKVTSWQDRRKRREIRISASQVATKRLCARKWWLEKVRGLEVPATTSQVFGTVLHGVCERFLSADDLGRDPETGQPVDLYPPGWHVAQSRFDEPSEGEATPVEQDIIRKLVAKAIEDGILERRPGRQVERQFFLPVLKGNCPGCGGKGVVFRGVMDAEGVDADAFDCPKCKGDGKGTSVNLIGFIDLSYPDEVDDHKTSSSTRWLKQPNADSPNFLGKDPQMLIYAKAKLVELEKSGQPLPPVMTLRHNQYVKDPDGLVVRKTECQVTREQIEAEWARVQEDAREMVAIRDKAEKWSDCPEPRTGSNACNAFGGCAFRSICGGKETEASYEARLVRLNVERYSTASQSIASPVGSNTTNQPFDRKDASMSSVAPVAPGIVGRLLAGKLAQKAATSGAPAPSANGNGHSAAAPPAGAVATAPQGQTAAAVATAPPVSVATHTLAPGLSPPPWANPSCRACIGHPGFNSKGNVCRICDSTAPAAGRPTSGEFQLDYLGDGTVAWVGKTDPDNAGVSALPGDAASQQVVSQERAALPVEPSQPQQAAPAPQPMIQPQPVQQAPPQQTQPRDLSLDPSDSQVDEGDEIDIDPANEAGKPPAAADISKSIAAGAVLNRRGRPPKGFILCTNIAVAKGIERKGSGRGVHYLADILKRLGESMVADARQSGLRRKDGGEVDSMYDIDAFSRRDWLSKQAPALVPEFGSDFVVVNGLGSGQSEMRVLVDALRPHASMELIPENI